MKARAQGKGRKMELTMMGTIEQALTMELTRQQIRKPRNPTGPGMKMEPLKRMIHNPLHEMKK